MLSTTRNVDLLTPRVDGQTTLDHTVPEGFPTNLVRPLIWQGKDFASNLEQYVYHFNEEEISAFDEAISYFKRELLSSRP